MSAPKLLLIKTSSLGDVLHNLPAVTDICRHLPDASIDWVVEESFAALPPLHPGVRSVLPVAIRRWRKSWWRSRLEVKSACRMLKQSTYDYVIDSQGLLKSAVISRCTHGPRCGYDWNSAREPLASLFYEQKFHVSRDLHAVERNRLLAAQALGYELKGEADYGIVAPDIELHWLDSTPYAVFLHATSRDDKLWSESCWIELGQTLAGQGLRIVLPWGSDAEKSRSARLSSAIPNALCPPRLNLNEAAALLGRATAVVGVDTGLSHLAAALGVATVGIYTATDPGLTGLYAGKRALNLGGKRQQPDVGAVLSSLRELGVNV